MCIFKMIDTYLCKHHPRYKLRRICKAIGIKPYPWQREFALGRTNSVQNGMTTRKAKGKTTAVMLRLLMKNPEGAFDFDAFRTLCHDPDWRTDRIRWYSNEYRRLKNLCLDAGIPVIQMELYRMIRFNNPEQYNEILKNMRK